MIPAGASQSDALISVSTPFGTDVLLVDGLSGREGLSELFHFDLRMRSTNRALSAATIVGSSITVTLKDSSGVARYVNGIVTYFANAGGDAQFGYYTAQLAPQLWLLTLGRDRAIYQNQSALDIVEAVLSAAGITYASKIAAANVGNYATRDYCVQYDESPFQFISRLMEDEGIFYFFTFTDGGHTLVLADDPSAWQAGAVSTIFFAPDTSTSMQSDRAIAFEAGLGIGASQHMLADYDSQSAATSSASAPSSSSSGTGLRYTFPGKYASTSDASRKAAVKLASNQVEAQLARGESFCYSLTPGTTFTLAGHPDSTLNVEFVVRGVTHTASRDTYRNAFEVFAQSVPFRAPLVTPLPHVAGTHTANVVGPSGEEIWTDATGRIKIKFHWDRSTTADENSSCWVRVSQASAGQGWGQLFLPRIGQEVIVSYVDGDPDRPLVTGSVYNLQSTLPVSLPGSQTQSVIRSRSSKNGTAGNELRMEDLLNSEQLYLHAQKDMVVSIENALTTTLVGGDETLTVQKGNRTVQVQTGNETHTVQGTRSLTVNGDETRTNGAKFTQTVTGDYTLNVSGNLVLSVGGSITITGSGASSSIGIKSSSSSVSIEAGTTNTVQAGTTLSLKGATVQQQATTSHSIDGGGELQLSAGTVQLQQG